MNDALKGARELLRPHFGDERTRRACLNSAFFPDHKAVLDQIDFSGAPADFTEHCVLVLDGYGPINGRPALCWLLEAVKSRVGPERQLKFDEVIRALDEESPGRVKEPPLKPSAANVRQTDRTDHVFISYAREDAEFAGRLKGDLEARGIRCWMDTSLPKDRAFAREIPRAIEQAEAVLFLVSDVARESEWVLNEVLYAQNLKKRRMALLIEDCKNFFELLHLTPIRFYMDYQRALEELVGLLRPVDRRSAELAYLSRLEELSAQLVTLYTPLPGNALHHPLSQPSAPVLPPLLINPGIEHIAKRGARRSRADREPKEYDDILKAFAKSQRTVLLGAPGAGKTTSLLRLARDYLEKAQNDPEAPLPLFIRLGYWDRVDQGHEDFFTSQLDALGDHLADLLANKRAILLLDGLNEIPAAQRRAKTEQLRDWLLRPENERLACIISCRRQDYEGHLDKCLDSLTIKPLPPSRIYRFIENYLNAFSGTADTADTADALFWEIAGGPPVRGLWEKWQKYVIDFDQFFTAEDIPGDIFLRTAYADDMIWRTVVKNPANLLELARTPYFLTILLVIHQNLGELPRNRGNLFDEYVESLLVRTQSLIGKELIDDQGERTAAAQALLASLGELAWRMQTRRVTMAEDQADTAQVVLPLVEVTDWIDRDSLATARTANLLEVSKQVRFNHQLLQEYFVALEMQRRLQAGTLNVKELWPNKWERTGWEEAAILLAGLDIEQFPQVIDWLSEANPEVTVDCIERSGVTVQQEVLERLRAVWIPRLTDTEKEPDPRARAAVGRALGSLEFDGYPLDNRKGVWGVYSPNEKRAEVNIEWVKIPGGRFIYPHGEQRELETFFMSRYPVTYSQFQAFVDDPDGYTNDAWWKDLRRHDAPEAAEWTFHNHPRETVTWREAVAFCRWLSALRNEAIALPTEWQWERAARGRNGRQYPWGDDYRSGYANINEIEDKAGEFFLGQTSAVGLYPSGRARHGVHDIDDLAGNVWEWCLNKYEEPENIAVDGFGGGRVVRGGSWAYDQSFARAAFRYDLPIHGRGDDGIRLVRSPPHR